MPGRFKSCRRSTSELFSKEEEQPPELPEMTPLRWRSASMKQAQSSRSQISTEQSSPSQDDVGQPSGAGSPARSAEQRSNHEPPASEPSPKHVSRSLPDAVPSPEKASPSQVDNGSRTDQDSPSTEGPPVGPRNGEHVGTPSTSETDGKGSVEGSPVLKRVPVEEIVEFQPVDLDQKYRRKELIRHVTAAKIQNREESLLNNPSLPTLEARKAPTGDEPAAMTIEFLRARLLAERSASKATKQQMTQLTKKVADLEARLAAEVELRLAEAELRKKADVALQEAMAKLNQLVAPGEHGLKETPSVPAVCSQNTGNGVPKESESTAVEVKPGTLEESSSNVTVLRPESEGIGLMNDPAACAQASLKGSSGSENGSKSSGASDPGSSPERDANTPSQSKSREDTRAAIEERLQTMWRQIGQEMAALAEVKGGEDSVRQELMGWMGQVPKVLQSKQPESSKSLGGAKLGVILPGSTFNGVKQPKEGAVEDGSKLDSAAIKLAIAAGESDSFKRNASIEKNVSEIVELYEAQETAQRVWEENFEAQQNNVKDEDGLPPLVTADGNVISENGSTGGSLHPKPGTIPVVNNEEGDNGALSAPLSKSKSFNSSLQTETHLSKSKSFDSSIKPAFARSRTKSFDLSHDTTTGNSSRRASFNGRIEIIDDQPAHNGVTEDFIDDEDAEELPNGIYLHHSRDEDDSYRRASKDLYGRTPERLPPSRGFHSPGSRSDRGQHSNGYNSPGSRSDRGPRRERFPSHGGPVDSMGDLDSQGWPVREVKDRASRDVYYAPVMNNRNPRGDGGPYTHSEREYLQKSRTERASDESLYRSGPGPRWEPHIADPSWVQRQEERRMSDPHYSRSSSEDGTGAPYPSTERDMRGPYIYPDRDHLDYDLQYRNTYRQRGELGPRGDVYRGMPPPWQEAENPGMVRSRSMGQRPYAFPPPYSVDEPHVAQNIEAGGYNHHGRSEMLYPPHATLSRSDYFPPYGMPGPRSSMNGYSSQPDNPVSVNRGYTGWDAGTPQQERSAAVVPADDGEAGEVLKALRIAKQQIKSSTNEPQGYMTAQYTVSSEHRYGVGGQVSKTSYTVEAPVGYPRVTKTFHEGWHLEGSPKGVGMDVKGAHVSDLITTAGPLAVTNGETSYVEKLNVGRGIQFFFS